jgi:hypothetical protein
MNVENQTENLPPFLELFLSSETRPNSPEEKKIFYSYLDIASSMENLSLPDKMQVFNEQYFKDYLLLGSDKKDPTIQESNSFALSNVFLDIDNGKNLSKFLEENDLSNCTSDFSMYSKSEILEAYDNKLF